VIALLVLVLFVVLVFVTVAVVLRSASLDRFEKTLMVIGAPFFWVMLIGSVIVFSMIVTGTERWP